MPALDADISRFTSDGILLTAQSTAIRDGDANAIDMDTEEREMFFVSSAHAQVMLDQAFTLVGRLARPHEAIGIADSIGLGTSIPLSPALPLARILDASRDLDDYAVLVEYSFDHGTDSYALAFAGVPDPTIAARMSMDRTDIRMDSTTVRFDNQQ